MVIAFVNNNCGDKQKTTTLQRKYCLGYHKFPNVSQLRKVEKLIGALSNRHNRLLICRLDLIAYPEPQKDFGLWLKSIKKRFKKTFYGYIASLELSKSKGWHYHLIIILDGNKYLDPMTQMQYCLHVWKMRTGNDGWIPTFNKKKGKVRTTGRLNRGDKEVFDRVMYGASYLCKTSQKPAGSKRLFNMTQLKSITDKEHYRQVA
jgi:hypothetical protein